MTERCSSGSSPPPGSRRPLHELVAVLVTALVFQVAEAAGLKGPFIAVAVIAWGAYLAGRLRGNRTLVQAYGLGRRGLRASARACAVLLAAGIAALAAYRLAAGWRGLPPSAFAVLALYPVWAFVQQLVLQALLVRNLVRLGLRPAPVVGLAALGFGLAHFPDVPLMALCAVAGAAWVFIFLRFGNLWPLVVCHTVLGTLAYYWVLERDPWAEIVPV